MEQLRQVGEAVGSLKALKVFQNGIQINQKQCCLLIDAFNLAFDVIVDEIKQHLSFDEYKTKWKELENPLKELHRVIKEGEYYIRKCWKPKDWWAKALSLNLNTDCVDFHLHNLLWCLFIVLEAIENVGGIRDQDNDIIKWKRTALWKKYEQTFMEPKLFFYRLTKLYLVSREMCISFSSVWKEDRWLLTGQISEKNTSFTLNRRERQLAELLLAPRDKLHPITNILEEFQQGETLGEGIKKVQWMGESFALRHCFSDLDSMSAEISLLTSVMHTNVLSYMYAFSDEAKKEYYVLMEPMDKNLLEYIGEVHLPLLAVVDVMLQIARGMEYLHSKKIYHGDLKPRNILIKSRKPPSDGYLHVKITGFGRSSNKNAWRSPKSMIPTDRDQWIWYAPEVLAEQEGFWTSQSAKFTEKADVYSFAMICFQLLTGKIPFENFRVKKDDWIKFIKDGLRQLFFTADSPKCLTDLTNKCWSYNPSRRPSFSSICRVLRYTKRFLIKNADLNQPDTLNPPVDYFNIEMSLSPKFDWRSTEETARVSEVPWQMFCYRVLERYMLGMNKPSDARFFFRLKPKEAAIRHPHPLVRESKKKKTTESLLCHYYLL